MLRDFWKTVHLAHQVAVDILQHMKAENNCFPFPVLTCVQHNGKKESPEQMFIQNMFPTYYLVTFQ